MPKPDKTCFVISPIGDPGTPTRERADLVFDFVIAEVLSPMGYEVERADKLSEPGIITNQIIDRVTSADIVIADLSERNPNVFYELAIRHATRKPYVHLIAHDEDIPFDNAAVRAIKIDVQDLRSVKAAKEELARQVAAAMAPNAIVESPVSIALSIQEMRTSGDEEKLALSAVVAEMSQVRRTVSELTDSIARIGFKDRPIGDSGDLRFLRHPHSSSYWLEDDLRSSDIASYSNKIVYLTDDGKVRIQDAPIKRRSRTKAADKPSSKKED